MFPNNFEIKNFSFQKQKHGPTNCTVCHDKSILRINCVICQNPCCLNKCTYQITPNDINDKPWLSDKVWSHICLNCLPRTTTASNKDVKKLFAQIFEADEISDKLNDTKPLNSLPQFDIDIPQVNTEPVIEESKLYEKERKSISDELIDFFIGANLNDLARHNNIKFDKDGKISNNTIYDLINSFKSLLKNPL